MTTQVESTGVAAECQDAHDVPAKRRRWILQIAAAVVVPAVVLVITGVGILIKEHLDRIGPLTLIFALALAGAACYVPAVRAKSRGMAPAVTMAKRSSCSAYCRSVIRAGSASAPYRRSIWSSRRSCADSTVTSPPSRVNDVFALEMSSPSTSAETVATTAVETDTRFFVSSVK